MSDDSLLKYLKIRSFKSILDQTIELGLVNVFIGANGSGKSNILEALGVLSAAAFGRVDDESLMRRGVRPGVPRLYKSSFPGSRIPPFIVFEAGIDDSSYSVSLNNPLDKPRPAWLFNTHNLKSSGWSYTRGPRKGKNSEYSEVASELAKHDDSDPAVKLISILRDYAIYSPNTTMLRGLVSDPQTREPVGLGGGSLADAVKELQNAAGKISFLKEAVAETVDMIDWIKDFDISSTVENILAPSVARPKNVLRFRDRYMRTGNNTLTAHDASEGVLYVLFCAVLALLPNAPKCSAIDNLDHALNPRLLTRLIEAMCRWIVTNPVPRQLLFTAHNPAVLDGLPLKDDRVRIFAVDRNSEGNTVITRVKITEELWSLAKDKGWPLSHLWVMGHLGGVPNV